MGIFLYICIQFFYYVYVYIYIIYIKKASGNREKVAEIPSPAAAFYSAFCSCYHRCSMIFCWGPHWSPPHLCHGVRGSLPCRIQHWAACPSVPSWFSWLALGLLDVPLGWLLVVS